jgi:hypothetical protein
MTTLSFPNGDSFVGSTDEKNRPHGHGVYRRANGAEYVGAFVHGERHGDGVYRAADGSTYEGQWAHGSQNGHGEFRFGDSSPWSRDVYRGSFVNGMFEGEGVYEFSNGDRYHGDYRDNKICGIGKFQNADGTAFVGQFLGGVPHGHGAFFLSGRRIARTTGLYERGSLVQSDKSVPDSAPEETLDELRRRYPPPPVKQPAVVSSSSSSSSVASTPTPTSTTATSVSSMLTSSTSSLSSGGSFVQRGAATVSSSPSTPERPDDDASDEDVILVDPSSVDIADTVATVVAAAAAANTTHVSPPRRSRKKKTSTHRVPSSSALREVASVDAEAAPVAPASPVAGSGTVAPAAGESTLIALEAKARDLRRQLAALENLISSRGSSEKGSLSSLARERSPMPAPAAAAAAAAVSVASPTALNSSSDRDRPLVAREDAAIARLHIESTSAGDDGDGDTNDVVEVDGVKRINFRRRIKQLLFSSQAANDMAVSQSQIVIDIEQLHKAELLEPLGGGGSGCKIQRACYKGFSFVVKLYRTAALTPLDEELIKKEILIMEALDHPNIVHYIGHDFHSQPDVVRLYMELFLATLHRDIRSRADASPKALYSVDELLTLMTGICSGLQYLHTLPCPIVHRDLKSENVFLVAGADKGDVRVKIGDFGEAKAMQGSNKWLETRHVGSAEFRAPEVYGNTARMYNEKADIWSFGMVVFELLTLDLPYRASVKSHFEIPGLVEKGIRATLPELPPMYVEVLPFYVNCTEADPKERPPAKELVRRLKKMAAKRADARRAAKEAKSKK